MIVAIDVYYTYSNQAKAVAIVFENWQSQQIKKIYNQKFSYVEEYEPGNFYKRELPCIKKVLSLIEEEYEYIIIDGYVSLGSKKLPGLGAHLWNYLKNKKPIIGVAKNYFKDTPENCSLFRGKSKKPLYITSIGIELDIAKTCILKMSGKNRIPDLLKAVDLESKK